MFLWSIYVPINSLILGFQDLYIVCRRMWVAYSHSCKVLEWLSWDKGYIFEITEAGTCPGDG